MKLHRFIIKASFAGESFTIEDKEIINQVRNVLRFSNGDQIILFNEEGLEVLCRIISTSNNGIEVEKIEERKSAGESVNHVILYCAILKKENFELVVQKATEIGIKEIVPVITKRTVKLDVRQDRLEKIIKEAVEQSGRGALPKLHEPMTFEKALENAKQNEVTILFDASGQSLKVAGIEQKNRIGIFIGPEGGFEPIEIESAKNYHYSIANLGALTLRGETAAIIACYLALHK